MKKKTFGGLILGVSMLAFASMASATGYHHNNGESAVFISGSIVTGGSFGGWGSAATEAGMAGGGNANSSNGDSSVAGGSYQGGAVQGSSGSEITGTNINAAASQDGNSSTASTSTGSFSEGTVHNGTVTTFASSGASAAANSYGGWNHHYH